MTGTARLAAREIGFAYRRGAPTVVAGWDADFPAGSVSAITGPSGCGKSTRLYLLGLMLRADTGAVEIDGRRVDHLPDADRSRLRAHRFGFVFQDAALDPTRTVIDNVVETAIYRGSPRRAAVQAGLALIDRFQVDVPAARRPGQISGGQAQRIALCRALLGNPDIVLADEPTGNLDAASAATVLSALRAAADGGACVVVITHNPGVAAMADTRIVIDGPP